VEKHKTKEIGILVILHYGCILFVEFLRKRQKMHNIFLHSNNANPVVKHHLNGTILIVKVDPIILPTISCK
jgi:hypothetical protein